MYNYEMYIVLKMLNKSCYWGVGSMRMHRAKRNVHWDWKAHVVRFCVILTLRCDF